MEPPTLCAIVALNSTVARTKSVLECRNLLNELSHQNKEVTLNWIPGHTGQRGNTIADALAKMGANNPDDGLEPRTNVSNCVIRQFIKDWMFNMHDNAWKNRTDCRQTKIVLPSPSHKWNKILNYNKTEVRALTQLATGHANLRRHRYLMGLDPDPDCEKCGMQQTSIHILTECPGHWWARTQFLGALVLNPSTLHQTPLNKIIKFATYTGYWENLTQQIQ